MIFLFCYSDSFHSTTINTVVYPFLVRSSSHYEDCHHHSSHSSWSQVHRASSFDRRPSSYHASSLVLLLTLVDLLALFHFLHPLLLDGSYNCHQQPRL